MSLRALVEIVVHFESFRNVDLFFQGIYFTRSRIYYKRKPTKDGGSKEPPSVAPKTHKYEKQQSFRGP